MVLDHNDFLLAQINSKEDLSTSIYLYLHQYEVSSFAGKAS